MKVFRFKNHSSGGFSYVSAVSIDDAWAILQKNAYADCNVKQRYELQEEVSE